MGLAAQPMQALSTNLPATPPECFFIDSATNAPQKYYRLHLVP